MNYSFIRKTVLLFFQCLFMFSVQAFASEIDYNLSSLGGNQWQYNYTLINSAPTYSFDEFTIYFDVTKYASLSVVGVPTGWDALVSQPDSLLPADGYYDAVRLGGVVPSGASISGFSVSFAALAGVTPTAQAFDLVFSDPFNTVYSGTTISSVPEPETYLMFLCGLAIFGLFRLKQKAELATASNFLSLRRLLKVSMLLAAMPSHSFAKPMIEGFDLVSSTRVDRTHFDYTYTIRIQGDQKSYTHGTVNVESSSPSTVVVQPEVIVERLDADEFIRTSGVTGTFTVRQDRTVPFDASQLKFLFTGTYKYAADSQTDPYIGTVAFMEEGGRPGHEGTFQIQAQNPTAGSTQILSATIYGEISFNRYYRILNKKNKLLSQGSLSKTDVSHIYAAEIVIPNEPFTLFIVAVGVNGTPDQWSKEFNPPNYKMTLEPDTVLLHKGETISGTVKISSISATGTYQVSMLIPSGFSGSTGPWTVSLTPNSTINLNMSLTAPQTGEYDKRYTISVVAMPVGNVSQKQFSNLQFKVE